MLDHDDPRLPSHDLVRFPATCKSTGEPMLVMGALFQLGQKVHRATPQSATKIEEVETRVIRALVFQDQTKLKWTDITDKPVRTLFAESEFTANPDSIVDVWDRQYVTKQYKRCKPEEAEIFIVTFRVKCPAHEVILDASGQAGKYFEPRDHTGRSPDTSYKVIWMPRKNFQDVMLAKQTSLHPTWLVRSGDRFGLRTHCEFAKDIHEQHRPDVDYMAGEQMTTYRVGPLPFGTTKSSLQKLYKEWGWTARPGQPLGQSIGQEGVFWSTQSSENPSHWVYSLEQGDILISPIKPHKTQANKVPSQGLVASRRTIQSMTQVPETDKSKPATDPWLQADSWSQGSGFPHALTPAQSAAIEASVAKHVTANMKPHKTGDVDMERKSKHCSIM